VELDNPVFAALSTVHAGFALRSGRVLRYPADVTPFMALPTDPTVADWEDAAVLVPGDGAVAVTLAAESIPASWHAIMRFDVVQMTGDAAVGSEDAEAVELAESDVPEMLALVEATRPGPFMPRTIELGRYVGFRRDGELIAMAGERFHLDGWTEISAVCTAPSHRGQGLASRLIRTLVSGINARSERPFLHTETRNAGAIRVYEALGFSIRASGSIGVISPS
jgi:predicted GNAT family acetyltransferase